MGLEDSHDAFKIFDTQRRRRFGNEYAFSHLFSNMAFIFRCGRNQSRSSIVASTVITSNTWMHTLVRNVMVVDDCFSNAYLRPRSNGLPVLPHLNHFSSDSIVISISVLRAPILTGRGCRLRVLW